MRNAIKPLLAVGLFAVAGFVGWQFLAGKSSRPGLPGGDTPTLSAEEAAEREIEVWRKRVASVPTTAAADILREARSKIDRLATKPLLDRLIAETGNRAVADARRQIDEALASFQFATARRIATRYERAWHNLPAAARLRGLGAAVDIETSEQMDARVAEADELLRAGRPEAARSALDADLELNEEQQTRWDEARKAMERKIRVFLWEQGRGGRRPSGTSPDKPGPGSGDIVLLRAPPALPGYPPPDVKRLAEARVLLKEAREAFGKGRYAPAAEVLEKLEGFYGDLTFVQDRAEGMRAVRALARYRTKGPSGLFHATKLTRNGARMTLRYDFKTDAELLDWEPMKLLAHQDDGKFVRTATGVQGTGVAWLVHRAYFDGPVTIRAKVRANQPKAHGLVLCEQGNETRHLLWLISNHWLVEGENYVKERPGHSILMFGKGVNVDVPVESPEVGFIFRGGSLDKPTPGQGGVASISFGWAKKNMRGTIQTRYGKGERAGSAVGDDGRGIKNLRAGLMVVQNAVVFREVEITGKLHKDFERKRVDELLALATLLD